MYDDHSDVIRDIALEAGLVTPAQAEEVWESQATTGKSFSDSLIDTGLADRPTLLQAIADHMQVQFYSAVPADPGEALTKLLKGPRSVVRTPPGADSRAAKGRLHRVRRR